jgi:hypothetical protein
MSETAIVKAKAPDPLREITGWIIAGHTEPDIMDAIREKFPNAKARPLIVQAMKQIADAGEPDKGLVKGFAIEGTREIYRKALEVGDHQTALRALKQLVDLAK